MCVTELGMITEVKKPQLKNVPSSMRVRELEIVTDFKLQLANAPTPMRVTELGIVTGV